MRNEAEEKNAHWYSGIIKNECKETITKNKTKSILKIKGQNKPLYGLNFCWNEIALFNKCSYQLFVELISLSAHKKLFPQFGSSVGLRPIFLLLLYPALCHSKRQIIIIIMKKTIQKRIQRIIVFITVRIRKMPLIALRILIEWKMTEENEKWKKKKKRGIEKEKKTLLS